MCDPITVVALTAASTGMQMYSAYQEGQAQSRYYNAVAEQKRAEGDAAIKRGERQVTNIQDIAKMEGKQFAGQKAKFNATQAAQMAAQGITGVTADDIEFDSLNKEKMDEYAIRYNADVKSWETKESAKYSKWASETEADQFRFMAKNAKTSSYNNMMGSLLGGATSLAMFGATGGFGSNPSSGLGGSMFTKSGVGQNGSGMVSWGSTPSGAARKSRVMFPKY
jgi:Tfp pilus assembly major pilin PilA